MASMRLLAWPDRLAMPERMPRLPGTPLLVSSGPYNRGAAPLDTDQLVALLPIAGATVSVAWQQAAQRLTRRLEQARARLTSCGMRRSPARTS